jgi:oligopeptide/dipeptide ABC transporter ATP-binding protein
MILRVRNLTVRLPIEGLLTPVVRGVGFDLPRGEIAGIVGESGCGKSITSAAFMGLLPRGSVVRAERLELCGQDLQKLNERGWRQIRGRKAAMIFQHPMSALNPSFTVGTQLSGLLRKNNQGIGRAEAEQKACELLHEVGISPRRLWSYPHELSGGMAQRVTIAMALACKPSLLIADEPTTGLDATIQAQILDLLLSLRNRTGMTVILVSHDIGLVERYADRIMVMYSGEIVEDGPASAVARNARHPYTRGLLNSLPSRQDSPPKTPLTTIPGVVPAPGEELYGCRFAPRCPYASDACRRHPELVLREDYPEASFRCIL